MNHCENCTFYVKTQEIAHTPGASRGECHRHPPAWVGNGVGFAPVHGQNDWCGELELSAIIPADPEPAA